MISRKPQALIIRVKDPSAEAIRDSLFEGLNYMGFEHDFSRKRVLIKPNLCYYWDYTTGETTDPRLISALIDFLREKCGAKEIAIVESDASAMRAKHAFEVLGYVELAERKMVKLINLSTDESVEKRVTVDSEAYKIPVPRILLNPNTVLINVPKIKVGPFAGGKSLHITCALKNMYGCIHLWQKVRYHEHLNQVIVAINKLIKPHLIVADGIVALGKNPIKLGIIVVGLNPVIVDSTVGTIMGYNPNKIEHLRLAEKEGLRNITVQLEKSQINELRRAFPKRNRLLFTLNWKLQLFALRTYINLVGDVIPPPLEVCT
ncbi:MAG: DUF362 domain-containing protein [Candidatus Bathyarchaeia archaeon]